MVRRNNCYFTHLFGEVNKILLQRTIKLLQSFSGVFFLADA
jgi:hypothetical protein